MITHCCKWLFVGIVFMLTACSTTLLDEYASNKPLLSPEQFFNGKLTAQGVVKNRGGKVTRYFTAKINAYWRESNGVSVGTLEEVFQFNDGEIQYRTWTLTPTTDGYTATAGDVIGSGNAQTRGNAMQLHYTLKVNYQGSPMPLQVEDWMWLVDDNTLLNESTLRKWGFKVGSVQLVIQKAETN